MRALSFGTIFLEHHRLYGERFGPLTLSTVDHLQVAFLASRLLEDTLVAVSLTIGGADRLVDQRADPLTPHSICREIMLATAATARAM